jgi:hypothetical protein
MKEKWQTLEHNGPLFPKEYEYIGFDKNISPLAEEMLYHYSAKLETEYVSNSTFNKNFWNALKQELPKDYKSKKFPEDFSDLTKQIFNYIQKKKEDKKLIAKEEKLLIAQEKDSIKEKYGWAILPTGEHIHKLDADEYGIRFYQVCGRKIGDTCSMRQLRDIVYNFYLSYGERARLAESNTGVDWKAVSHAFRAAYQVKEILTTGEIVFPLKDAQFLREIKSGILSYTNCVAPKLDELMTEVEDLAAKSKLPEKVNRKFWDDFLIKVIDEHIK